MTRLYIMCGLAFSGKSTLARKIAKHTNSQLIAFDKLWIEKDKEHTIPKNAAGWKFIRKTAKEQVLTLLLSGNSVVYDDNNSKKAHRDEFVSVARKAGVDPVIIYLNTPLVVIRIREIANKVSQERHEVKSENFDKVMNDFEVPTAEESAMVFKPETKDKDFLVKLTE